MLPGIYLLHWGFTAAGIFNGKIIVYGIYIFGLFTSQSFTYSINDGFSGIIIATAACCKHRCTVPSLFKSVKACYDNIFRYFIAPSLKLSPCGYSHHIVCTDDRSWDFISLYHIVHCFQSRCWPIVTVIKDIISEWDIILLEYLSENCYTLF